MRDAIGNKLVKGTALLWHKQRLVYTIEELQEPVLDGLDAHIKLSITIPLPENLRGKGKEIQLEDFFAVVNPELTEAAERAMNQVLDGARAKPS